MGDKSNKKVSEKKLHKYDHIDNNYLTFDKDTANTMIICGLATAMSCLFFAIEPFGVIFYIMAILEKTQPESMTDADIDELKAAKEALMTSAQQVFAKVYEQAQGAAGAGPDMSNMGGAGPDMSNMGAGPDMGAQSQSNGNDDDVIDGEFKEL